MIRLKITMGFLWALLALALHVWPGGVDPARAQGTRKDDIVFNSRGIPLAGATVRVCAMPASGQPCTPLALIYSDAALTQALANPTTTDGLGNYSFYAAPGRYEIEISGPGITTKQLPNVILPNDPASPTFSGAVSAFSLTLSGNLTVSGNTTVVGNMASGTLNLANQSSAPGSAGSGTVNLYTKTSDKRLYYKDDTGTEVGPLGTGAQTNVPNTFTAPQNIDADFKTKGPNPWFDVMRYGGYELASGSIPTTTGSITAGSPSLTLANAVDFANGQGILMIGAGPATSLSTPSGLTVAQTNIAGSTTYNYCVVAEDYANGRTACSAAASTTTGPSSLGLFTVGAISSCTRAGGVVSCTTTAAHHLSPNSFIEIQAGTTGNSAYEGTATLITASGTTFTFNQVGAVDDPTGITAGTVRTVAENLVRWTEVDYTVLRSYIYRCTTTCTLPANAANYSLAGVTQGMDGGFIDEGASAPVANIGNGDVSATAPTSASAQWLSTTISSGGGTTSLTLANNASTTVSSVTVVHDNVPAIKAACTAIKGGGNGGGILYIPNNGLFPINSTLNLGTACNTGVGVVKIKDAGILVLNGTIIPRGNMVIEGEANFSNPTAFYQFENLASVNGQAYPLFLMLPGTSSNVTMRNFIMKPAGNYQSAIVQDQDGGGNNVVSIVYDNIHVNTGACFASPYIMGGGFGFFWHNGGWSNGASGGGFHCMPSNWMKANYGLGITGSQLPGIIYTDKTYVFGGPVLIDAAGINVLSSVPGHMEFKELLSESGSGPIIRTKLIGNTLSGVRMLAPSYADFVGGAATPLFDFTNGNVSGFFGWGIGCAETNQPIFQTGAPSHYSAFLLETSFFAAGCGFTGIQNYVLNHSFYSGVQANAASGGLFQYLMSTPAAPTVSNVAGTLASGTYFYKILAEDYKNNTTVASPASAGCTSNGSQACVVTWTLVPGQASTTICRGATVNNILCGAAGGTFNVSGTSFTDNLAATNYTNSLPSGTTAGGSILDTNGLAAPAYRLAGGGNIGTTTANFTAPRAFTQPDVSGINEVSSYVNSAYDNFRRTNGALGSNWTAAIGTIQVSANSAIATALSGQNASAIWANGGTFSPQQFAQSTITFLNAGTDLIGPAVRYSTSGSGYTCIESNNTLALQRDDNNARGNLSTASITGAVGDVLRIEANGSTITCTQTNSSGAVVTISATDSTYSTGNPGMFFFGTVATQDNWSGGNLHPLAHMDVEQDWTKTQHFLGGLALGPETFSSSPRSTEVTFLPGALTSTWTGATWTLDKAISITRVQIQVKTAPSGCATNATVRVTDGTSPINLSVSAAANDSGPITQNYAAGASLTIGVQTAAAGCTTSPADANVVVQYRMQ